MFVKIKLRNSKRLNNYKVTPPRAYKVKQNPTRKLTAHNKINVRMYASTFNSNHAHKCKDIEKRALRTHTNTNRYSLLREERKRLRNSRWLTLAMAGR